MAKKTNEAKTIETVAAHFTLNVEEIRASVDRAVELNRQIKAQEEELEKLKVTFREAASQNLFPKKQNSDAVEIRSENGNCATVCAAKDTPKVIKGVDLTKLKTILTQGEFDLMFEDRIVMTEAKKFETAFNAQRKPLQNKLLKFVEWTPNTAQVQLSK